MAAGPVEGPHTQLAFEALDALDALGQWRLGHTQPGRGRAEVLLLGHGHEALQMPHQIHERK
ncbi:hypothetical protein ACF05L_33765 [Streptomyces bobili]|uniref:hypothetical protein n=1 Tax=Streptomyces bobili TaxID=67280 RepID=UPI0036FE6D79